MKIDIVTLFPDFFKSPLATSMIARACQQGLVEIGIHDLRDFAADRHRTVDDTPYGGGRGMVIKPEPVAGAWETLGLEQGYCIYLTADGVPLDQQLATRLSLQQHLVLLCGHYKGEPAGLVLIDAVVRLIPGVLGDFSSALEDSFHEDLLDCPWYTRPAQFMDETVPEVLLSGNHQQVRQWRRQQALRRTFERRPDLLKKAELDDEEQRLIARWSKE